MSRVGLWYNAEEDTGFRDPHLYCYLPPHRLRVSRPSQDWVERSWGFLRQRARRARPLWLGQPDPFGQLDQEVAEIMERLKRSNPGGNP